MLPQPTQAQKEQAEKQLTTPEYQDLKVTDSAALRKFYTDWLDTFAEDIRREACKCCLPPWLLASIVLGEVTAMDTYFGITERTLESWGLGSSVGLAQITIDTALKYRCTEGARNFDALCRFVAHRRGEFRTPEAIVAEWMSTPIGNLPTTPSPSGGPSPDSEEVRNLVRSMIRFELLNPLVSISTSACYLCKLFAQARGRGTIAGYAGDGSEPWGKFDFGQVDPEPCPMHVEAAAEHLDARERMRQIAKFFGAAHNDDALSGFEEGVGLTQGENAGSVADDLIGFGLIPRYHFKSCPPTRSRTDGR